MDRLNVMTAGIKINPHTKKSGARGGQVRPAKLHYKGSKREGGQAGTGKSA